VFSVTFHTTLVLWVMHRDEMNYAQKRMMNVYIQLFPG
jgi:hypothetical protein